MEGTEGVSLIHILRKERKSKGFLLFTDILNSCYLRFIFFPLQIETCFQQKYLLFGKSYVLLQNVLERKYGCAVATQQYSET